MSWDYASLSVMYSVKSDTTMACCCGWGSAYCLVASKTGRDIDVVYPNCSCHGVCGCIILTFTSSSSLHNSDFIEAYAAQRTELCIWKTQCLMILDTLLKSFSVKNILLAFLSIKYRPAKLVSIKTSDDATFIHKVHLVFNEKSGIWHLYRFSVGV